LRVFKFQLLGKSACPVVFIHRHRGHEILGEVHGIIAARPPIRPPRAIHPLELPLLFAQRLARERNDDEAIELLIDETQLHVALNLGEQGGRIEARVLSAGGQEAQ
jgi:hypothetical protein